MKRTLFFTPKTTIGQRDALLACVSELLLRHGLWGTTPLAQFDFARNMFRDRGAIDLDLHNPINLAPGNHRIRSRAAEATVEVEVSDGSILMRRLTITDRAHPDLLDQMLALLFATGASNGGPAPSTS